MATKKSPSAASIDKAFGIARKNMTGADRNMQSPTVQARKVTRVASKVAEAAGLPKVPAAIKKQANKLGTRATSDLRKQTNKAKKK